MTLDQFNSEKGYTFEEGVAFLRLCNEAEGVIKHIAKTRNRATLHARIHKLLRLPSTAKILRRKGYRMQPAKPVDVSQNMGNSPQISSDFTNEIEPKSNEIEPKSNENEPKSDDTEIIITKRDVRSHENTRYEDMPNEITQQLWLKRQEMWRELQQAHLKMRQVPEGEEHDEERAKHRAQVMLLDEEIAKIWELIDTEIERFNAEKGKADKKAKQKTQPTFDVSTYRAYISKALRKKSLTDAQRVELQHRVDAMRKAKIEIKTETIEKLKAIGIKVK